MFAIAFFFIALTHFLATLFVGAVLTMLFIVTPLLPRGRWRVLFVMATLASLAIYPFMYRMSASYSDFKKLCESLDRQIILKKIPVDFIYFDEGYASDCIAGAQFMGEYRYKGFDCFKKIQGKSVLYRFTKLENWYPRCGLECFAEQPIAVAEAQYKKGLRDGYLEDGVRFVTSDNGVNGVVRKPNADFTFRDALLIGDGEMAFAANYTYRRYANTLAEILALAGGIDRTENCSTPFIQIDPRQVYPPLAGR